MLPITEFYSAKPLTAGQEAIFFSGLKLANGVYKTTCDRRMEDLNALVLSQWRAANFRPAEIMDVGVSSGITTAEWFDDLSQAGLQVRITATDFALLAHIVPLWWGAYAIAKDGCVLRHIIFGLSVSPRHRLLDYFTGYFFVRGLANKIAAYGVSSRSSHKQVLLVSHRALRCGAIEWKEDDLLARNPVQFEKRFDAVRAANILNRGYFNDEQLHCAVTNLKNRLGGPGARLIINRTLQDGSNHATMFRLADTNRFEVEARLRDGSEIEDIVLQT